MHDRRAILGFAIVTASLGVLLLSGCSGQPDSSGPASSGAPPAGTSASSASSGSSAPAAAAPVAGEFGKQHTAGHMEFTLKTEPEKPKVGSVKLIATVGHHGEPHTGATVKATLQGPPATTEPTPVEMAPTFNGIFEGTAKLTEPGDWEVKVDVTDGHDAQTFVYKLEVAK